MHLRGIELILVVLCFGLSSIGCAPPATNKPPIAADELKHLSEKQSEHEGHTHAHTYAEAISQLESIRDQIRDAFAKGDLKAADEAVHSIGHALEDVTELAKTASLSEADQTEIGVAVETLLDTFGKLDEKLHANEEPKYDSVAADIDAGLATLKKFVGGSK